MHYIWLDFDEVGFFYKPQDFQWLGVFEEILEIACLVLFWANLTQPVTVYENVFDSEGYFEYRVFLNKLL